jgi:hypothetical protein
MYAVIHQSDVWYIGVMYGLDEITSHTQLGQANDGHVPPGRSRILLRQCAQMCAVQSLMTVPYLRSQRVVVCQVNIPLSVVRAADIIHCHAIVMGTTNP